MATNIPEGMMPVAEFGELKGITAEKVINMIRDGFYVGRKVGDDWFIDKSELQGKGSKRNTSSSVFGASQGNNKPKEVIVTDIQMPFMSMVIFMVKWVIAAIPAFIILGIIFLIFAAIFSGFMHTA